MSEKAIRDRLVEHGQKLFRAPKQPIEFTTVPEADTLLNDLARYPHAFVLGCVMDRQVKAEQAWLIPFKISEKLNGFSIAKLRSLSRTDVLQLMTTPEPLHRFIDTMSGCFFSAVHRIDKCYHGVASEIWANKPSSAEVVHRFREFHGVGPKIATMAVNILAREFKVPFSDYYSIDISADVHIQRVFSRLGLCPKDATPEQLVYKAKELHPDFPGMMDSPCWEIGRNWCKPRNPVCSECYVKDLCPTAAGRT